MSYIFGMSAKAAAGKPGSLWELAVLTLLREEPMHPYLMQRLLRERHKDDVLVLKRGSLYHAIHRLTRLELIEAMTTDREGRRPERTTYRLTPAGEEALVAWLREMIATPQREPSAFMASVSFLIHLPPADAATQLEGRAARLQAEIKDLGATLKHVRSFVARINLVEAEYLGAMLRAELTWARGLVDEIRAGRLAWDLEKVLRDVRRTRQPRRPLGRRSDEPPARRPGNPAGATTARERGSRRHPPPARPPHRGGAERSDASQLPLRPRARSHGLGLRCPDHSRSRAALARRRTSLLLLGLALSVAEEFVIQQTSIAPLPWLGSIPAYGRVWGVNWCYFLYMLGYEAVWIVLVPILVTELAFPDRRHQTWLRPRGLVLSGTVFGFGSFIAWFTWTQQARPSVFHVPVYEPPRLTLALGGLAIVVLAVAAYAARGAGRPTAARRAPRPWVLAVAAMVFGFPWSGLMILVFVPQMGLPLWIPMVVGGAWGIAAALLMTRWASSSDWHDGHRWALAFGALLVCMLAGFLGAALGRGWT